MGIAELNRQRAENSLDMMRAVGATQTDGPTRKQFVEQQSMLAGYKNG